MIGLYAQSTLFFAIFFLISPIKGNILDMTCVNLNPEYDSSTQVSYAAILSGHDTASTLTFQRTIDLTSGADTSGWCSAGDDQLQCGLPSEATIDAYLESSAKVTLPVSNETFGVYGCRAERYNWTTESVTMFIRKDAQFRPQVFTKTVSLDENVRLVMESTSTGSINWRLNGQMDLSSDVSKTTGKYELNISKASSVMAGVHHIYKTNEEEQGALMRLIVRECLDNLWGPDCEFTCPTCYNGGVCDDRSGRCICAPGFKGDHCESACQAGFVGKDCLIPCSTLEKNSSDCSGVVFCLKDPYGCSCAAGWSGLICDEACATGFYGSGCSQTCHCSGNDHCNPSTGTCPMACDDGWTGDQCQVKIIDIIAINRPAGVPTSGSDKIGIFLIGDHPDSSIQYYIGREVDTGPGETGHGALAIGSDVVDDPSKAENGLPTGTSTSYKKQNSHQRYFQATFTMDNGGASIVGAYRTVIEYKGRSERTIMLNEHRNDGTGVVWTDTLSITVSVGETANISVVTNANTADLRWRHNGGDVISIWNGNSAVTIAEVRKSDEGIYECYVNGDREDGTHAIIRLIVRGCPSSKWGANCSNDCPVCYARGVCHDVTGECVCRPGFKGDGCEEVCSKYYWGRDCSQMCSDCSERLFAPPDPVGISCIHGLSGNGCTTECDGNHFGADCELECNCPGNCDRITGCNGSCTYGYNGPQCQELTSNQTCPSGFFGTLCNYPCHCEGIETCHRFTGQCPDGALCREGWAGSDCQQALPRLRDSPWIQTISYNSLLLVWNAWSYGYDYGNGPVHSYQIDYNWTDDMGVTHLKSINATDDSSLLITDLLTLQEYEFSVRIRREVEGDIISGRRSPVTSAQTPCEPPRLGPNITDISVNGIDTITIHWKIPEPPSVTFLRCNPPHYNYTVMYWPTYDSSARKSVVVEGNDIVSQTINNLTPCTQFQFSVVIINAVGQSGPQSTANETTHTKPPDSIDEVTVDSKSFNQMILTWSVPESECGVPMYNITRKLLVRDQCELAGSDSTAWIMTNETNVEFNDLSPYSTYEFTVLPIVQGYEAANVIAIEANSTESVPSEPVQYLTVDRATKQELGYSWTKPPCGSRHGKLFYDYTFTEISDDAAPQFRNSSQDKPSVRFEELPHWTRFNFTVCPLTSMGQGPCHISLNRTLPSQPTRPRQLDSKDVNQTYAVITWMIPESINGELEGYYIAKNADNISVDDNLADEMSYAFSDLIPDDTITFKVRAVSNGGEGEWSEDEIVSTLPIPLPNVPEQPQTASKTHSQITIKWTALDESNLAGYRIIGYDILIGDENVSNPDIRKPEIPLDEQMTYSIDELKPSTLYVIKIRAKNEGGEGDWSPGLEECTMKSDKGNGLAIGLGVGIPFLIIIILIIGYALYHQRRPSKIPPPIPKTFQTSFIMKEQDDHEQNGSSRRGSGGSPPTSTSRPPVTALYKPILVRNFAEYVKSSKLSDAGFEKEFKDLYNKVEEHIMAFIPENKAKNRYKNVVTFDGHRVKLNKELTELGADYINATFMDGYINRNAYIASQGPNTASVDDFWQMVYDQKSAIIVMLTNLVEKQKVKCLKYWPDIQNAVKYGDILVTNTDENSHISYIVRRFSVQKLEDQSAEKNLHWVIQYHYTIWHDMSEPESVQPLLDFRNIVKKANPPNSGPMVVHCSAGAGRTGTFITIDSMMDMIQMEQKLDVFNFVNQMRKRRTMMVQVKSQYEFIYEALLQWCICRNVTFPIADLAKTRKQWQKVDPKTGKSDIMKQFELLEFIAPTGSIPANQRGNREDNVEKNRFPDKVPADRCQPFLMTKGDYDGANEYVNASFFDFEGKKNAHVCTQCPLQSTITDFLRLLWDYDFRVIVHLNAMDSTCGQYWPDFHTSVFGSFTMELLENNRHNDTTIVRVLKMTSSKAKGERRITQYQYTGWPNNADIPNSKLNFCDLIAQVENGNHQQEKNPLLIVCMDGVGVSGTFLASMAMLSKVKTEKIVDAFSAVKLLRRSRTGVVDTIGRYDFLFDVMEAYLDSVQTYANFTFSSENV